MTQSELLAIIYNLLKAWGKSWVQDTIDFKTLVQDFNLITKCSNHNRAITFASHLKTALSLLQITLELLHIPVYTLFITCCFINHVPWWNLISWVSEAPRRIVVVVTQTYHPSSFLKYPLTSPFSWPHHHFLSCKRQIVKIMKCLIYCPSEVDKIGSPHPSLTRTQTHVKKRS